MTNLTYDVYYFIRKFAAIPEERWHEGAFVSPEHQSKMCALGHCGMRNYAIPTMADKLLQLMDKLDLNPGPINDGVHLRYPQSTPKRRILAALRDVACKQLREDHE